MAIYHFHVKVISRGKGRNVVAAAAYRRATEMFDERVSRTFNYKNKENVIYSEIMLPEYNGTWLDDYLVNDKDNKASEKLWNLIERVEKRDDARLAREIEFALPVELNDEQNIHLAREFIQKQFVANGMIADWSIHADECNPHVHVLLSLRQIEQNSFGKKIRDWNSKSLVFKWRQQWAEYANRHLNLHHIDARIDHRSHKEQGIDLKPSIHLGRSVIEMKKRSLNTDRLNESSAIKKLNLEKLVASPALLLRKLSSQKGTFEFNEIARETLRYTCNKEGLPVDKQLFKKIISNIEYYHSVFSEREIALELFEHLSDSELFVKALTQLKSCPELLYLGLGEDGRDRFTTKSLFELENNILQLTHDLADQRHFTISESQLKNKLEHFEAIHHKQFTKEQRLAIAHLLNPARLTCLVGRAGTGKSFSLAVLREIWEAQGVNVHGVALSGIAASNLKKDAGFKANTIAAFLLQAKGSSFIKKNDVIVMDEAGMSDSYAMFEILKLAKESQAKIVLVGDHQQIQPVGPGATFRAILEEVGFAELQTIYRQEASWQQDATRHFSQGNIEEALTAYDNHDCIHIQESSSKALSKLVADWLNIHEQEGRQLSNYIAIAHRNKDVDLLNAAIREKRIHRNEIGQGCLVSTVKGNIHLSAGDRILFLANDANLQVKNGQFATVINLSNDSSGRIKQFTAKLDGQESLLTIDPLTYSAFIYGYAATVHKTQGITVDHTLVYAGGKSWDRHLTYVAMSRHRKSCHLYADQETHSCFKALSKGLSRLGLKDIALPTNG